jgi:hypothetical protein
VPSGIGFVVPLENENRWSDLLAVLIVTDPAAAAGPLGLGDVAGHEVTVEREVRAGERERVDLLVKIDGVLRTVLEAKVLSGLGTQQLARYSKSYDGAASYRLVYPCRLLIHAGDNTDWNGTTWESLLAAFVVSSNPWVAETATAWRDHLADALPRMDPDTRWNGLREGENFALAMRARMSWVYERLSPPQPIVADLMQSGGSKAWVTRMRTPAAVQGYEVGAEAEEHTARGWPRLAEGPNPLSGPQVWVGLRQHGVTTSAGFDWEYLLAMWPTMAATRSDWMTTRPGLVATHDRQQWKSIGSPAALGYGFGDREATKRGTCMFGAKFRLPADIRLGDLVDELQATASLILAMSKISI